MASLTRFGAVFASLRPRARGRDRREGGREGGSFAIEIAKEDPSSPLQRWFRVAAFLFDLSVCSLVKRVGTKRVRRGTARRVQVRGRACARV